MPSLSALRAFDAAARVGSFSTAARHLNVTHAAVAQAVRALEAELGVPLLVRAGRGVQPTAAGRRLVVATAGAFDRLAAAVEDVRDEAGRRIRVTTTVFVADAVILPRIGEFWLAHPGVEVSFTPTNHAVDLIADGYDVAVRAGGTAPAGCESTPLGTSRWLAAAAPRLAADPAALEAAPWIGRNTEWERGLIADFGLDPDAVRWVDLGDPSLESSAAQQGLGKILGTEVAIHRELRSGALTEVPTAATGSTPYHAVTVAGPQRPVVAAFVAWLASVFAEIGGGEAR